MKKILFLCAILSLVSVTTTFARTEHNVQSANFLATKWIINDNSKDILKYNLDYNITRREMLKVMMNLSGKSIWNTCSGKFSDMPGSDWGCKYAEAALENGYIAANKTFRPNDNVTQIEALKMIMQAKGLEKDSNTDWRAWYLSKAQKEDIVDAGYLDYNLSALRGWIFSTSARSYTDFDYIAPDVELTPEEEELFKFLLEL